MLSEKEANAYIQKILTGEIESQTDEERGALQRLGQVMEELAKAQQEMTAATKRAEEMRALSNKFAGKREAYLEMLVNIEMRRRATDTKPLSLVDLENEPAEADQIKTTEETDDTNDGKPGRKGQEAPGESEGS